MSVRYVSMPTIDSYLEALQKLFVITDVSRGMCDPSVAVTALGGNRIIF